MTTPCCAQPVPVDASATHAIGPNCLQVWVEPGGGGVHVLGASNTPPRYEPNSHGTTIVICTSRLWAMCPLARSSASDPSSVLSDVQLPMCRSVQNAVLLSHVCDVSTLSRYVHDGWYGTVRRLGAVFLTR